MGSNYNQNVFFINIEEKESKQSPLVHKPLYTIQYLLPSVKQILTRYDFAYLQLTFLLIQFFYDTLAQQQVPW